MQVTAPEKVDRTQVSQELWQAEKDRIIQSNSAKNAQPSQQSETFFSEFVPSPQDDRILVSNHGLSDGIQIRFKLGVPSNRLPNPLLEDVTYYLVNSRLNDFKVSLDQDGTAVDILDKGTGTNDVWLWSEDAEPPVLGSPYYFSHDSAA